MASQKYGVISQAQFMAEKDQRVVQTIVGGENMKKICTDDFLIHLRSFQGGIEWSANEGKVSPAYTVLRPNHGVYPPFFYYLLKSAGYIQELRATTNQLRDGQSMNYSQFAMVPLIEVPREEQVDIAHFLDRETAQIDDLIAKQERLIELLAERRRTTINEAYVCEAPPAKLRHVVQFAQTGPFGTQLSAEEYVEDGVPVINPTHIRNGEIAPDFNISVTPDKAAELARHRLVNGDIILGRKGEVDKSARATATAWALYAARTQCY